MAVLFTHYACVLFKATPRTAKAQSDRPAAARQPLKKTFKNVDSKLANVILNEIVDTYVSHIVMPMPFKHFLERSYLSL